MSDVDTGRSVAGARRGPLPSLVLAQGEDQARLRRLRRDPAWTKVGRGAYLPPPPAGRTPAERDRRAALARVRAVHERRTAPGWFSHQTAALLWGCDLLDVPTTTHLVQRSRPSDHGDASVARHHGTVPAGEQVVLDGLPVTSLERTVVDCACLLDPPAALVVADSGLRIGADPERIDALLRTRTGRRGVARARRVLEVADARAESPGESLTRWHLLRARLPAPELQVPLPTRLGLFRGDLGWDGPRVVVEFDGFVKYSGAFGRTAPDAVFAEKRRQDAIEEAGWRVLRVTWSDLRDPAALAGRVARARSGRPRRAAGPRGREVVISGRGRHAELTTSAPRDDLAGLRGGGGASGRGRSRRGGVGGGVGVGGRTMARMSEPLPPSTEPDRLSEPGGGSTGLLERVEQEQAVEPGDHERFAHYVRKEKIMESALSGKPVVALCGKVWVPGRDPNKFPVCPVCKEIYEGLREPQDGGDGDKGSGGGGRRWGFGRGKGSGDSSGGQ